MLLANMPNILNSYVVSNRDKQMVIFAWQNTNSFVYTSFYEQRKRRMVRWLFRSVRQVTGSPSVFCHWCLSSIRNSRNGNLKEFLHCGKADRLRSVDVSLNNSVMGGRGTTSYL